MMYSKFKLIILFKVAITYALKINDNKAKMLIAENNQTDYIYGLDKDNDILDVTCNGIGSKNSLLHWSIARDGVNPIYCGNYSSRNIDYRVHLRAIDNGTMLTCRSFARGGWSNTTLKLILNKSYGTSKDKLCSSMSNVFCLDRGKRANIDVIVNNETLQGDSDQRSATYQYKYNAYTPNVTITCAASNDADKLIMCGYNINKESKCTKDAACSVISTIYSAVRKSISVIHCYTMKDGWVSGNIAQLMIYFDSSTDTREETNTDLSVIGLPTIPRAVDKNSKNRYENKKELYVLVAIAIIVVLIVIVLLVLVARRCKLKSAGEQKNWNSAAFEHTNSAMEFTTENNYYVVNDDTRISIVGNQIEPFYREPDQTMYDSTSAGASPAIHNSPRNTTYANFNEANDMYSNIN